MKLVFCGTPSVRCPYAQCVLRAGHEMALAVTQPDRPSGRGLQIVAPPVKEAAIGGRPSCRAAGKDQEQCRSFAPSSKPFAPDAILVVAYGRIIPKWMLDLPRFGNLNLHGSLLPKYRGAAPIQWASRERRSRSPA